MKHNDISRRQFLKTLGASAVATSVALTGYNDSHARIVASERPVAIDRMTYRMAPTTGNRISLLGYRMMHLPVKEGCIEREYIGASIDQAQVNRLVDYAIEHGVNYFDTAPTYCNGLAEYATGLALSRHPRNAYFIATKMSNLAHEMWSRKACAEIFENSLKALRTNYIDYYLLHGIDGGNDALAAFNACYIENGVFDFFIEQRQCGRIHNVGFSYHGDVHIFDLALQMHDSGYVHWDFVQIPLNYVDWKCAQKINPQNTNVAYLYGELHRRGIPIVVVEPLLGGRLATMANAITVQMKQRNPDCSVASWALRYAATYPDVLTILSAMTYMEHLQDNLRSLAPLSPLTDNDRHFLDGVAQQIAMLPNIPCTACNDCLPCPCGLDIPAVFAHYNKCIADDQRKREYALQNTAYYRQRRDFLLGYDRHVPRLRQSHYCNGCRRCLSRCPQHINIHTEMFKISDYVEKLKQSCV